MPGSMIQLLETLGLGTWGKGKWQSVDPLTAGKHHDRYDLDGKGMFARLIKAHGPLKPGHIFAPRLHPAIGGAFTVENFRPTSAPEAIVLMHQMDPFVLMDHRKPQVVRVRMIGRQ